MPKRIIDMTDSKSIFELQRTIKDMNTDLKEDILEAVKTLETYRETLDFSPQDANRILAVLGIDEKQDPVEMFHSIRASDTAFILRKKFFDTAISQTRLESTLIQIIAELSTVVSGNILTAVSTLIKNMMLICMSSGSETMFKELCFKFFTQDKNTNEVILLVINVKYIGNTKNKNFLTKLVNYATKRVNISFFGAVVKTNNFNDLPALSSPSSPVVPIQVISI